MEDLYGIQTRRQGVAENIQKALVAGYETNPETPENNKENIQKGRVGVYEDNAENRRLNRVGQQYGKKKEEEQPKDKTSSKKEDEPSDKKGASEKQDMSSHAAKASDGALKRAAADEKAPEDVRNAANEELKKRGSKKKEKPILAPADMTDEDVEKLPKKFRNLTKLEDKNGGIYYDGVVNGKEVQITFSPNGEGWECYVDDGYAGDDFESLQDAYKAAEEYDESKDVWKQQEKQRELDKKRVEGYINKMSDDSKWAALVEVMADIDLSDYETEEEAREAIRNKVSLEKLENAWKKFNKQ